MKITSRHSVDTSSVLAVSVLSAPASVCDASNAGSKQIVRYQVDYIFYKAS